MKRMTPLETDRLSFEISGSAILHEISCTVEKGSLTALAGPNGAGKSTLLSLIAGSMRPSSGSVLLDGVDSATLRPRTRARFCALVEQQADLDHNISVFDVVLLGRTPHLSFLDSVNENDTSIAHHALSLVDASHLRSRRFQSLSGGEQQRVLIARALTQEPSLLLLDEPINHLDIRAQLHTLELMQKLTATGVTIVAAMHDLTLVARYFDNLILLNHGEVVGLGRPREVLTRTLLKDVYGVHADLLTHPADDSLLLAFSSID